MTNRRLIATLLLLALITGAVFAAGKKKKKKEEEEPPTQVLELPKEPPVAVTGDIERLAFHVTPLSAKGLLTQQMRDSLKSLLRDSHTPLKIRAFVAGSGDLRRVPDIVSEVLTDKHVPLPVVTVVQAGALTLTGAQVVLETTSGARKPVNTAGLAFLAPQQEMADQPLMPVAPLVARCVARLKEAAAAAGSSPDAVLRVTCLTTSLDDAAASRAAISTAFPRAVVNYVQFVRAPAQTIATCEGVARLLSPPARPAVLVHRPGAQTADAIAVAPGRIAISGVQLGFGTRPSDIQLAFDRLDHSLETVRASRAGIFFVNFYTASRSIAASLDQQRRHFFDKTNPAIYNSFLFEGLGSMDASFGVEADALVR